MAGFDNDCMYADNADFTTSGAGSGSATNGLQTNGQLWIGTTALNAGGTHINVNTLTPGAGISITNGPGTITIGLVGGGVSVEHLTGNTGGQLNPDGSNNFNILGSGGVNVAGSGSTLTITNSQSGMTWTDVTSATQALSVSNGYFTDRGAGVTYTLPATAALGDIIIIDGKLGITTIAQNAGQSIRFSSAITTVGVTGSAVGTNVGDCVTLRCSTAGASTVWIAENFNGNWTIN